MPFTLRPYQTDALAAIAPLFTEPAPQRGIISLATGLGKTVLFSEVIHQHPGRILVLAHRDELITQALETLRSHLPPARSLGRVAAEINEADADVVVASVQTLRKARLMRTWTPGTFAAIIVDEAHHAAAPSYQTIFDYLQPPVLLGVTATPYRSDRVTLASTFDRLLYHYGIREGIRGHYLVDLRPYRIRTNVDLDPVHTQGGDLAAGELADLIDTPARNQQIVDTTLTLAPQRPFLAFTASVAHAQHLAETYQAAGLAVTFVHAQTPIDERRAILAAFKAGTIQGITNCGIFTEGFDAPWVQAVILARPTKSLSLFTQMVGRGTRTHPGKTDCIIIDAVDNTRRHHIISIQDLIGLEIPVESGASVAELMDLEDRKIPQSYPLLHALRLPVAVEEVPDLIAEWVESAAPPPSTWQAVAEAMDEYREGDDLPPWVDAQAPVNLPPTAITVHQREALLNFGWDADQLPATKAEASWAIQRHLTLFASWAQARVAAWVPLTQERPEDIQRIMFSAPWHYKPATDKQRQLLHRLHIPDPPYAMTAGEASWIIDRMKKSTTPAPKPRQLSFS